MKFDAAAVSEDGVTLILQDAKTRFANLFPAMEESTRETMERVKAALLQNPGFKVVYEFRDEKEAEIARKFLVDNDYGEYITAIARAP